MRISTVSVTSGIWQDPGLWEPMRLTKGWWVRAADPGPDHIVAIAVLSNMVATYAYSKFSSSVAPATFQVLYSYLWWVATILDSAHTKCFHPHRQLYWTVLFCRIIYKVIQILPQWQKDNIWVVYPVFLILHVQGTLCGHELTLEKRSIHRGNWELWRRYNWTQLLLHLLI